MATPVKTLATIGLMTKAEATYGAGGSVSPGTNTDCDQLAYDSPNGAPCSYTEDFDGTISINPGGPAALKDLAPSARVFTGSFPIQFRGPQAAYAANVKMRGMHVLVQANGWDATLDTTVNAEKVTYTITPGPTGFTSVFGNLITAGESFPFTSGFTTGWKCTMEGDKPPIHTFDVIGLLGDPVDSSAANTLTYFANSPPKFESAVVTIGSFLLPDVVKVVWDAGRAAPSPRLLGTASLAHAGWWPSTQVNPTLTITVERTALIGGPPFHTTAGLNPYQLRKRMDNYAVSVQLGTLQYNRITWNFPQAQLTKAVQLGANGSVATWELEFSAYTSTPIANDAVNIVTD
jgi:hypothetical protein